MTFSLLFPVSTQRKDSFVLIQTLSGSRIVSHRNTDTQKYTKKKYLQRKSEALLSLSFLYSHCQNDKGEPGKHLSATSVFSPSLKARWWTHWSSGFVSFFLLIYEFLVVFLCVYTKYILALKNYMKINFCFIAPVCSCFLNAHQIHKNILIHSQN